MDMDIFIHARNTELLIKEQIPFLSNNVRQLSNTSVPLNNPEQTDKLGRVIAERARVAQATTLRDPFPQNLLNSE